MKAEKQIKLLSGLKLDFKRSKIAGLKKEIQKI